MKTKIFFLLISIIGFLITIFENSMNLFTTGVFFIFFLAVIFLSGFFIYMEITHRDRYEEEEIFMENMKKFAFGNEDSLFRKQNEKVEDNEEDEITFNDK